MKSKKSKNTDKRKNSNSAKQVRKHISDGEKNYKDNKVKNKKRTNVKIKQEKYKTKRGDENSLNHKPDKLSNESKEKTITKEGLIVIVVSLVVLLMILLMYLYMDKILANSSIGSNDVVWNESPLPSFNKDNYKMDQN